MLINFFEKYKRRNSNLSKVSGFDKSFFRLRTLPRRILELFTNIFHRLDLGIDFVLVTKNTYANISGFILDMILLNLKLFPIQVRKT